MPSLIERLVPIALAACGSATLWTAIAGLSATGLAGQLLLLQVAIGAALILAPVAPAARFPAIVAGLLGAAAPVAVWWWTPTAGAAYPWLDTLQLVALALAGSWLLRQHRMEARWDGVLGSRQEGW
jgi:hypothetical protein